MAPNDPQRDETAIGGTEGVTALAARIAAEAIEVPASERESLIVEVRRLLALHENEPGFLAGPLVRFPERDGSSHGLSARTRIGRYEVVAHLGSGGMADVYEVREIGAGDTREAWALKMLRPGGGMAELTARFQREIETLRRLHHHAIVRVLKAGAHETLEGVRPYFVMELVRGLPITEYAHERGLDVRQRLELFADLCEAVEQAHLQLVMHRDIKPENVRVTGEGRVKVLDFGVAKSIAPDTGVTSLTGEPGRLIGTLAYMSPEQTDREVDLRADVYSLGVVLFELLTDRLPHDPKGMDPNEFARAIRERDAPALDSVEPSLRGDLSTIAAQALRRDRNERYGSVGVLLADVRRYLRAEPVLPHKLSLRYLLRRYVDEHRVLVVACATAAVALAVGTGLVAWQAVRATRAERLAERRSDDVRLVAAEIVNDLLVKLHGLPGSTQARRLNAERAAAWIQRLVDSGSDDPETRFLLARAYLQLSLASGGSGDANAGDERAGIAAAEHGIVMLEGLIAKHPGDARFRSELAHAYSVRFFAGGDAARTEEVARRARAMWKQLVLESPEDRSLLRALAYSLISSGVGQAFGDGQHLTDLDESVAMYETLMRRADADGRTRLELGVARFRRATALHHMGDIGWEEDALAAHGTLANLLAETPKEGVELRGSIIRNLARCDALIARQEAARGEGEKALARVTAASALVRASLDADPDNNVLRLDAAELVWGVAAVHGILADRDGIPGPLRMEHLRTGLTSTHEAERVLVQGRSVEQFNPDDKSVLARILVTRQSFEERLMLDPDPSPHPK